MSEYKRPHTVIRYFTKSFCLESIIKYDKDMLLHGEQRSWWDRNHHYPKELSIYQHGSLIRTIKWYINGNIQKSINIYKDMKEICEYYSSGSIKYRQNYKLGEGGFVRHGELSGFYRNGNRHYIEIYDKGNLQIRIRYISDGRLLSGYNNGKYIADDSFFKNCKNYVGNFRRSGKVIEPKEVIEEESKSYGDYVKQFLGRFIKF